MKIKTYLSAASLAVSALLSNPAAAVFVSSFSGPAGNQVTDFSTAGLAAINLDLASASQPTVINFQIEQGDIGAPLAFNAVVANLLGGGIDRFLLTLDNATFDFIGSVETTFGSVANPSGSGIQAGISFAPPETFGFNIGNPFLTGAQDWSINIAGLAAGDTFTLRMAVPEPATLPLVLAGLLLAGGIGHKRQNR